MKLLKLTNFAFSAMINHILRPKILTHELKGSCSIIIRYCLSKIINYFFSINIFDNFFVLILFDKNSFLYFL